MSLVLNKLLLISEENYNITMHFLQLSNMLQQGWEVSSITNHNLIVDASTMGVISTFFCLKISTMSTGKNKNNTKQRLIGSSTSELNNNNFYYKQLNAIMLFVFL